MSEPSFDISQYCFYNRAVPDKQEIVVVRVMSLGENTAKVQLLEYKNREAMIPYTEITRTRIRSVAKALPVGSVVAMEVMRVDHERMYIDLGKKMITKKARENCNERFQKAKLVQRVLLVVSNTTGVPFEELQKKVAFPLYERYENAAYGFIKILSDKTILAPLVADFAPAVGEELFKMIQRELAAERVKLQANIRVTCYGKEGVNAIRDALLKAEAFGAEEPVYQIEAQIADSPQYRIMLETDNFEAGAVKLMEAIKVAQDHLADRGGECVLLKDIVMPERSAKRDDTTQTVIAYEDEE